MSVLAALLGVAIAVMAHGASNFSFAYPFLSIGGSSIPSMGLL
jgi:hypothetical protein